jgi:Ca2+-binding RTX toxin-like protein
MKGGAGNDLLDGGDGIDSADFRDKSAPVVVTLNGASDAIATVGAVAEDTLRNVERVYGGSAGDTLTGDAQANHLYGYLGDDLLKGGPGADSLDGSTGVDTADYSDKTAQVVVTLNGSTSMTVTVGGVAEDTVRNIENVIGSSVGDRLTGDGLANTLSGGGGNDVLKGGGGNDVLDGGAGADSADFRDKTASVVLTLNGSTDAVATVGGVAEDTVRNVERVFGGSGADTLIGDRQANRFDGGPGADHMAGNGGDDTYVVDNAGDTVTEGSGGGIDLVESSVSFNLHAQSIENLTLTGTAAIDATGNSLANVIVGNSGANKLAPNAGNDLLTGAGGADTFLFSASLNAATNLDHVTDFASEDTIQLENSFFTSLTTTGTLSASAFVSGAGLTAAQDASDRIVYNTTTGALFYDADGVGGAAAVQFAVLDNHAALTNADFVVV